MSRTASMRPRLLHLGYRRCAPRRHAGRDGFNEAEAFTPRIPITSAARAHLLGTRFNEAEAFTPRIRGSDWIALAESLGGFNEAEAFTPRIHADRRSSP